MSKITEDLKNAETLLRYIRFSLSHTNFLNRGRYLIRHAKVIDIIQLSRRYLIAKLKLLEDFESEPEPGQFVMIWLPGIDYIPMSIADYRDSELLIFFKVRGEGTRALANSKNKILGVTGPLGKPIDLCNESKYLLVGGGTGLAPLIRLAKKLYSLNLLENVIWGTRSSDDVGVVPEFFKEVTGSELTVCTEDCSMGYCGKATDLVTELMPKLRDSSVEVIAAGPNDMLASIASMGSKYGIDPIVIMESTVKCGLGLCGECILGETGLSLCRDGPAFRASKVVNYLLNKK